MNNVDNKGRAAFIYLCVFGVIEVFGLFFGINLCKSLFGFDMTVITGGFGFFEFNTMNLILFLNALGLSLMVAQEPVVGLIGGLAMGSIVVVALGKVYALLRDSRLAEVVE